jgi:tetratricopeptide (TPR) repeat protein
MSAPENEEDVHEAYRDRGGGHGELGRYERAIEDLNEAIFFDPESAEAGYNLRQYERAIEDYDEVILLDPQNARAYNTAQSAPVKVWITQPDITGASPSLARSIASRIVAVEAAAAISWIGGNPVSMVVQSAHAKQPQASRHVAFG